MQVGAAAKAAAVKKFVAGIVRTVRADFFSPVIFDLRRDWKSCCAPIHSGPRDARGHLQKGGAMLRGEAGKSFVIKTDLVAGDGAVHEHI